MATTSIWNLGDGPSYLPPPSTREFVELLPNAGNTVDVDVTCHVNFYLSQEGNYTLNNPTGAKSGDIINIVLTQDATGGRTLSFGSKYYFATDTAPVFTTTANKINFLCALYFEPGDYWICSWLPNMGAV